MKTISSPGSTSDHVETKFASEPPHVTSTLSAVAPGYIAATRERSSSLPFVCGYSSGTSSTFFSCAASGTNSDVLSGCTPLSEIFSSTVFSQTDCHRSISNGSIRISRSAPPQAVSRFSAPKCIRPAPLSQENFAPFQISSTPQRRPAVTLPDRCTTHRIFRAAHESDTLRPLECPLRIPQPSPHPNASWKRSTPISAPPL